MTDEEFEAIKEALLEECWDHDSLHEVLPEIAKRDAELARLLAVAEQAENAIAVYLRKKESN